LTTNAFLSPENFEDLDDESPIDMAPSACPTRTSVILPTIAILVSDQVKLIMNNSVPLLQVQTEILPDQRRQRNSEEREMCTMGLNDIIYVFPEFTIRSYREAYPDQEDCLTNSNFT